MNCKNGGKKMHSYFMRTKRIGFSKWTASNLNLAAELWGDKEVTRFICASGEFTAQDIQCHLQTEIENGENYGVQYWPVFNLESGEFIGCCGLRPCGDEKLVYEIGCHLRKKYWGKGYASEAVQAVIQYGSSILKATKICLGHHPKNAVSKKMALKFGFQYIGDEFYEPTRLYHPTYELTLKTKCN